MTPNDFVRYALIKSYMACQDNRIPVTVESVAWEFEQRMPSEAETMTTNQIRAFIAEQRG